MSVCAALTDTAGDSTLSAIRAVDCLANETAALGFARLFGTQGTLLSALTILLTLFIALFALALLTGRTRIGVSVLTPNMFLLGAVLTFATSWVAYQTVIWNLAVAAPDELAGTLLGNDGSAVELFATRLDQILLAISTAADSIGTAEAGAAQAAQGSFTPANLMWLAALLLMLGTVGVIVTARIALGVLLAIGPIFIVLALFKGTRGLFSGWLRALVLTGATPLFAVLGGTMSFQIMVPVLGRLQGELGIDGRAAITLFLIAAVHCALMVLTMKVGATMVGSWRAFEGSREPAARSGLGPGRAAAPVPLALPDLRNMRTIGAAASSSHLTVERGMSAAAAALSAGRSIETTILPTMVSASSGAHVRGRGIGSRFRPLPRAGVLLK